MDKQEISLLKSKFDELAHVDESGVEYWSAREIMTLFGYNRWENFYNAITKALTSIRNAQIDVKYHLREVTKMLTLGKNATRSVKDFELTRYACYIVAQNGDPRKEEIAFAQSYFAQQTRKQELIEEHMKTCSAQKIVISCVHQKSNFQKIFTSAELMTQVSDAFVPLATVHFLAEARNL